MAQLEVELTANTWTQVSTGNCNIRNNNSLLLNDVIVYVAINTEISPENHDHIRSRDTINVYANAPVFCYASSACTVTVTDV